MMFKKTLIASATAGLIAVGGLFATTETASAGQRGYSFQFGNSGIYFNYGNRVRPNYGSRVRPNRNCQPVFKQVRRHDRYGRHYWKRVRVGVQCFRPQHRRHYYARPHRRQQGFSFQFGF